MSNLPISAGGRHDGGHKPWFLMPWMLLVFALLFGCGQLALQVSLPQGTGDTRSRLRADYAPWAFMPMAPLDPRLLLQAASDLGLDGLPPIATLAGCLLPGNGCAGLSSPTPTPVIPATTTPLGGGGGGGAATPTSSPTPTHAVAWPTRTPGDVGDPPPMATNTPEPPTPTNTPITPTPTNTPVTPTVTSTPCAGCQVDIGTPDGLYATLQPGATLEFILSTPIVVDGNSDWDLAYFERRNGLSNPPHILLDLVVIKIGMASTGEWYVVLDWGNGQVDTNSSVSSVTETPNAYIPMSALYGPNPTLQTGILIDVDNAPTPVPFGVYDRLSVSGPTPVPPGAYGPGDYAEVDAIQVFTPSP